MNISGKKNIVVLVLMVFAIFSAWNFLSNSVWKDSGKKSPVIAPVVKSVLLEEKPSLLNSMDLSKMVFLNSVVGNIFEDRAGSDSESLNSNVLKLYSVVTSGERGSIANISGNIVTEGVYISGFLVKSISLNSVVLIDKSGKKIELRGGFFKK